MDPRCAGGRPRQIGAEDEAIIKAAMAHPKSLGRSVTRWSIRNLIAHPATYTTPRVAMVGDGELLAIAWETKGSKNTIAALLQNRA